MQSSCTSSDVEAESTQMELNQQKLHAPTTLDDGKNIQFDIASFGKKMQLMVLFFHVYSFKFLL